MMSKRWVLFLALAFCWTAHGDDYRSAFARVQSKLAQINALEDQINHLIEAKAHAHASDQAKMYVDEMVSAHKQLQEVYKTYHQELTKLRYQFPDQGEQFLRQYPRLELKSLTEMEQSHSLNAQLSRLHAKLRTVFLTAPAPSSDMRTPASQKQPKYDWYQPPALIK
jgi:hypothetical protein